MNKIMKPIKQINVVEDERVRYSRVLMGDSPGAIWYEGDRENKVLISEESKREALEVSFKTMITKSEIGDTRSQDTNS